MDFLDRLSLSPGDSTLVQSQAILFAAALFIGCTLFDAQSADRKIDQWVAPVATAAQRMTVATVQHDGPACYRKNWEAAPVAAKPTRDHFLPPATLMALID